MQRGEARQQEAGAEGRRETVAPIIAGTPPMNIRR